MEEAWGLPLCPAASVGTAERSLMVKRGKKAGLLRAVSSCWKGAGVFMQSTHRKLLLPEASKLPAAAPDGQSWQDDWFSMLLPSKGF